MTDNQLVLVPNDDNEADKARRQTIRTLSQQMSSLSASMKSLKEKTEDILTRYMATLAALESAEVRATTYKEALRDLNRIINMSDDEVLMDSVLGYYYENPDTTQQQAADAMGFSVTKLRSILSELKERGLVVHENRSWIALSEELPSSKKALDK